MRLVGRACLRRSCFLWAAAGMRKVLTTAPMGRRYAFVVTRTHLLPCSLSAYDPESDMHPFYKPEI